MQQQQQLKKKKKNAEKERGQKIYKVITTGSAVVDFFGQ